MAFEVERVASAGCLAGDVEIPLEDDSASLEFVAVEDDRLVLELLGELQLAGWFVSELSELQSGCSMLTRFKRFSL